MAGACLFKLPIILNIMKRKGGDGLSMSALYMETSVYIGNGIYNVLKENPFSTYGELFVVIVQNILIVLLIWKWGSNGKKFSWTHIASAIVLTATFITAICVCPRNYLSLVPTYGIVIMTLSKLPQIMSNFSSQDMGVQSSITAANGALGSFVKIYITAVETNDFVLLVGSLISFVVNILLFGQLLFMGGGKKSIKQSVNATSSPTEGASGAGKAAGDTGVEKDSSSGAKAGLTKRVKRVA